MPLMRLQNAAIYTPLVLVAWVNVADAESYFVKPRLSLGAEYSDNRFLRIINERSVMSYNQQASAAMGGSADNYTLFVEPSIRKSEFDQVPELNAQNIYVRGNADYLSEKSKFSLNLQRSNDTTLTNEKDLYGYSSIQEKRVSSEFSPGWVYSLGERFSVGASSSYSNVRYPDVNADNLSLVEYDYHLVSLSGSYIASERTKIYLQPYRTILESGSIIENRFETKALVIGGEYAFYETGKISFQAGKNVSDLRQSSQGLEFYSQKEKGSVYELSFNHSSEDASFTAKLSKDLTPTAAGLISKTDELQFIFNSNISESSSIDFVLSAWRYRSVGDLVDSDARDQARARATYNVKFDRNIGIAFSYDYQRQKYVSLDNSAHANTLLMSIIYTSENFF